MIGLSENIVPPESESGITKAAIRQRLHAYALIRIERSLLLVSSPDGSRWQAPGAEIETGVRIEGALRRSVLDRIEVDILVGRLARRIVDPASRFVHRYFHCIPKAWSSRSLSNLPRNPSCRVRLWDLDALPQGFSLDGLPPAVTTGRQDASVPPFFQTSNS